MVVADVEEVAPEGAAVAEVVDVVNLLDRKVLFFRSRDAEEQSSEASFAKEGVGGFQLRWISRYDGYLALFGQFWNVKQECNVKLLLQGTENA